MRLSSFTMRVSILSLQASVLIPVLIKLLALGVVLQHYLLPRLSSIQKRSLLVKVVSHVEYVIEAVTELVACHSCVHKLRDVTKTETNSSPCFAHNNKNLLSQRQIPIRLLVLQVLQLNAIDHCAMISPGIYVVIVDGNFSGLTRLRCSRQPKPRYSAPVKAFSWAHNC